MKNLKPSKLPEGTVIDDVKQGEYIKRADGIWEELDSDYMGDRERVSDSGYSDYMEARKFNLTWNTKSDDYFTDFKLIASDPSFDFSGKALEIHGPWLDVIGGYVDGTRPHECKGYNCEF